MSEIIVDPSTPIFSVEPDGQVRFDTIVVLSHVQARERYVITHEQAEDDPSRPACNGNGGHDLGRYGESTCARPACRDLRLRRQAEARREA